MEIIYEDDRTKVHRTVVGRLRTNVYILSCRRSGAAVLFDAAGEPDRLLDACQRLGVTQVLQTHGHWDHVGAIPAVRSAGYPVLIGPGDADMVAGHDGLIDDGAVLEVGDLGLHALATPGHTPGSTCFDLDGSPLVFAGDTLFPGGPGATRGSPERFATILESIETKLFTLDPETVVLPGHGDPTNIGAERPHLEEWRARGW